jgi:hypothetical protein
MVCIESNLGDAPNNTLLVPEAWRSWVHIVSGLGWILGGRRIHNESFEASPI